MVVDDLIRKLNAKGYTTIRYADDITILISGKHENTLCNIMQNALKLIEKWCTDNELSVNPKKTELILFTNKRKPDLNRLPKLFNTTLNLSTEVKYLGVIMDQKLNWKKHIETKIQRSTTILTQCKRMIGKTWGLKPHIVKWLYETVVRSSMTYACVIWWPRTLLITSQQELQKFQRQACLAITGSMSTTPTTALEVILGIPPLHLRIKEEAVLTALRLKSSGQWKDTNTGHASLLTKEKANHPQLEWLCDKTGKQHLMDKKYKIIIDDAETRPNVNTVEVYTDGSKTNLGTGTGVYCPEFNINITQALGKNNSVFQAECVGITIAAIAMNARKAQVL
ncbi:putative 115 kDa protein in type-1 retrotransposable element R1DM [Bicyclus anynana]|uniref:115 kDa protein in type-1 retrotransposable element R1DM n=1 Tax=Bicyclus anynana TaxID=110368 RepID=A0ABM3LZN7_BICAN|nr:putative 115 kDa protein in type-1 retrotransposable element R1DM [Bicyclus anynana]